MFSCATFVVRKGAGVDVGVAASIVGVGLGEGKAVDVGDGSMSMGVAVVVTVDVSVGRTIEMAGRKVAEDASESHPARTRITSSAKKIRVIVMRSTRALHRNGVLKAGISFEWWKAPQLDRFFLDRQGVTDLP
jgi:hypothetical protein